MTAAITPKFWSVDKTTCGVYCAPSLRRKIETLTKGKARTVAQYCTEGTRVFALDMYFPATLREEVEKALRKEME